MKLACPHCGQHLEVDDVMSGMQIQCPSCAGSLSVPRAWEAEPIEADSIPELRRGRRASVILTVACVTAVMVLAGGWLFWSGARIPNIPVRLRQGAAPMVAQPAVEILGWEVTTGSISTLTLERISLTKEALARGMAFLLVTVRIPARALEARPMTPAEFRDFLDRSDGDRPPPTNGWIYEVKAGHFKLHTPDRATITAQAFSEAPTAAYPFFTSGMKSFSGTKPGELKVKLLFTVERKLTDSLGLQFQYKDYPAVAFSR